LAEAGSRKRRAVLGIVEDHLGSKQKVVIFTGRRRDCDSLAKSVRSVPYIKRNKIKIWAGHGEVSDKVRDNMVQEFMAYEGPCCLIGTGHAFGESLNIDDADAAIFVQLPYSPGKLRQWEGRFHRASTKKPVLIYYVIAEGTVDEHMASILIDKLPAVGEVVEDKELAEAGDVLAGLDEDMDEDEFALSVLADLDFG